METRLINLQQSEVGSDYTAYRYSLAGIGGWLTRLTNLTVGTLWFPRFGRQSYSVHDPSTVVRVDSFSLMSPEDIAAVYGSPSPPFPLEIIALTDFIDPRLGDNGTDFEADPGHPDWGDDVSPGSPGPTLPYLQVSADYILNWPITFDLAIFPAGHTKWQRDECGHRFLLVGSTLTVGAAISSVQTDGTVISTKYKWYVAGAT